MLNTGLRGGYTASLYTPFMNTTNKCLRFFYRLTGTRKSTLTISAVDEDNRHTEVKVIHDGGMEFWVGSYVVLPRGLHWLLIQGTRASKGICELRLDDIEITQCSNFEGNRAPQSKVESGCHFTHQMGSCHVYMQVKRAILGKI